MKLFCQLNANYPSIAFYVYLISCTIISLYFPARKLQRKLNKKQSKFNIYYFLLSGMPSPGPGAISFGAKFKLTPDEQKDPDIVNMIKARNEFTVILVSLIFSVFLLIVFIWGQC